MKLFARDLKFMFCTAPRKGTFFTSSERSEDYEHIYNPMLDLMAKHYRKMYVERSVIDFRKVIVPAKRLRTLDDHIEGLMKKKEVCAVIEARDEFEDVDLVFDYFQLAAVKRRMSANVAPIYVQIPGQDKEIRCTLGNITKHATNNWPFKVYLKRYIVGRPNLLYVPISLEDNYHNASSNRGTQMKHLTYGVWVYSYNQTYPTHFTVDPRNVTTNRPYRLGDLVNTFPQGIVLHERYKKLIHKKIATIEMDVEQKFFTDIEMQKLTKEMRQDLEQKVEDEADEGVHADTVFEKRAQSGTKVEKKKKEKSLKKQAKSATQDFKNAILEKEADLKKG